MLSLLEELAVGPTPEHARLACILSVIELERWICPSPAGRGRPQRDRLALARAFLAKCVLQCMSTERLRHRLMADEALRICVGMHGRVPSSATFSRAFREMSDLGLGERAHEWLVRREYGQAAVWHVARDATAISNWERPPSKAKPEAKPKGRPGRRKGAPPKPKVQTRQQRQLAQNPDEAIADLPKACSTGTKLDSNGFPHWWNGYKLHADVDQSGFPLSVALTAASVHDSQAAIPLMRKTAERTQAVLYQLMDAGYVGQPIRQAAQDLGQVPIIAPKATPGSCAIPLDEDRQRRMKLRCAAERFFAQLKANYALAQNRYRGHDKVQLSVMLAVLVHCAAIILKRQAQ